ncbi:hypothetical protein GWN63_00675, partial [Candidatus Bathyarchaeota archaeon]|nr:hypothetical protein [Desulfobacterales bacterium]NIU80751.1 hypothetical protein [Candidatus Bathyarchaeota archaeon]
DFIISLAALFGLTFWIVSGISGYMYATDNSSLADNLILNITPHDVFVRTFFMFICLVAGLLTSNYFNKYRKAEEVISAQ